MSKICFLKYKRNIGKKNRNVACISNERTTRSVYCYECNSKKGNLSRKKTNRGIAK